MADFYPFGDERIKDDLKAFKATIDGREQIIFASEKKINEIREAYLRDFGKAFKDETLRETASWETAYKIYEKLDENLYKKRSVREKQEYLRRQQLIRQETLERIKAEEEVSGKASELTQQLADEIKKFQQERFDLASRSRDVETLKAMREELIAQNNERKIGLGIAQDITAEELKSMRLPGRTSEKKELIKALKEEEKLRHQISDVERQSANAEKKRQEEQLQRSKANLKKINEQLDALKEIRKERELTPKEQKKEERLKGQKKEEQQNITAIGGQLEGIAAGDPEAMASFADSQGLSVGGMPIGAIIGAAMGDPIAILQLIMAALKKIAERLQKALDTVTNAIKNTNNAVYQALDAIKDIKAPLMARLQGSDKTYEDIVELFTKNIGASPYISQQKVLENLKKLSDEGIAYNIEERAFLGTISEKIATTFDAFDSNLARLIRLQQADTTAARLGMEAMMTKFLNSKFFDTSYLSDAFDSVSEAIIDSLSRMNYAEGTEFEFMLQKWLGSLYSLGMSSTAVEEIAKGINMLSTGDVAGLASNTPMQTLLAMSASRTSNVDYAEALTEGLNASQLNSLMKSMVGYLKEIAQDSATNRVVLSAYGDIFGMSISDFQSIQNLTEGDISEIANATMGYTGAIKELYSQLREVKERTSLGERYSTALSNITFSTAEKISADPLAYTTLLITDLVNNVTGGLPIFTSGVMGNFLDLSAFTIEGIIKTAVIGANLLSLTGQIVDAVQGNTVGLTTKDIWKRWGASQLTPRGDGFEIANDILNEGTSWSAVWKPAVGSSKDQQEGALRQQYEESSEAAETTGMNEGENSFEDFATRLLDEKDYVYVDVWPESPLYNNLVELGKIVDGIAETGALDVNVVNTVKSNVDVVNSDVIKAFVSALSKANAESSPFGFAQEEDGDNSIQRLIRKLLNGSLDVTVVNSNFDTFLSKNLYQY